MGIDVLILNTAVADFRSDEFSFVETLVGPGGLAKCDTADMPTYSQQQYKKWIDKGFATAGGPGNTSPLMSRAGIKTAVGVNLGKGDFDGCRRIRRRDYYNRHIKNRSGRFTLCVCHLPGSDRPDRGRCYNCSLFAHHEF